MKKNEAISILATSLRPRKPKDRARYDEAVKMAIDALNKPEHKKGKWLPDNNNYYEERYICSVCGKSYKVDTCMGKPMWEFCPCGADMRGGHDETD